MRKILLIAVILFSIRHSFAQQLVHYWNFNLFDSEANHMAPGFTAGGGNLTYIAGGTSANDYLNGTGQNFNVLNLNARNGDVPGNHLRINNPIGSTLIFSLPTTGYNDVVFKFATRRSGSGAGSQVIAYSVDGTTFTDLATIDPNNGDPALQTFDFSTIPASDNNPDFKIRITFLLGAGGAVGNNRFDNVTLDGTSAGGDVLPPSAAFLPLNAATGQPVNTVPSITFNEPVRNIDNMPVDDVNADALVTFKLNDASGADVAFNATYSGNTITITPLAALGNNQQYYVALKANVVEDLSNNTIATVQSAVFTTITAQTQFSPGDLLLVAYQMNSVPNNDRIAFVTFVDILPGTNIFFTDAKYTTSIPAQCAGGLTWTAPAGGVSAGTVITINNDGGTADAGTVTGNTFGLSANGDQVIVYTGTPSNPVFITALSSNAWLATNASCSGSFSMLPASLTDGINSINLSTAPGNTAGNTVNAYYAGTMNGTTAQLKALIADPANWIGTASATPAQTWPAWAFPGPPVVTSATVINSTTLRVIFNRDLDPVSSTNLNNFTGIAGLTNITRTDNGALNDTLLLQYAVSFAGGTTYTLTVTGVKDSENRTMAAPFVFSFTYNTTVSLSATVLSVSEDAGHVIVQLNLNNPSASSVDLVVKSAAGTAGASDFTLSTQTLNFTGASNSVQTITVPISDDGLNEQDEYFVLTLENPSGLSFGSNKYITVYIRDNDRQAPVPAKQIELSYVGSYDPSGNNNATSEIVVYDSASRRLFVVSALQNRLDIADFSNPASIQPVTSIDMVPYGGITSVAVRDGVVAVSAPNANQQLNGSVIFFNIDGVFQKQVTVGALPDMITFTPDGTKVMTANEGQPNDLYTIDPEGSVSIIDISGGIASVGQANVTTLDFTAFNAQTAALVAAGVRQGFPGTTLSQNMEPEYITFSQDSKKAWVILQESNAFAVIDIAAKTVTDIWPLGKKDHSLPGNGFDASDRGTNAHLSNWPVKGLYMPDGIASYSVGGTTFIVGANEGDDREYSAFNERVRVNASTYVLDPTVFPDANILKDDNNLGRLRITTASGDTDGDGDFDEIHLIGGRSFSIWNTATKSVVFDSGDDFEQYLSKTPLYSPIFNSDHESNVRRSRSTSKGPEPEGLALANIEGKQYAFIGLERQGGVMVYDITNPADVKFVDYNNPRNLVSYGGDNGPEGIFYISNTSSPDGKHYIVVANEISGSLSVYRLMSTATCTPVNITTNPVNAAPVYNGSGVAKFSVQANGTSPVTYQWQENGVNISNGGVYSGTNTATLTITNAGVAMNGKQYRAYVVNCLGSNSDTSTAAMLTVRATPALRVSDVTVNEEDGTATVQVCLTAVTNRPVSFLYATTNGSASILFDYIPRLGVKTIPAGQTCATVVIPIVDNELPESTEQFYLNISNASNAAIADDRGVITIIDTDVIPSITINNVTVNENAGRAKLSLCLSGASNRPVSVIYYTSNGTATAGQDYTSQTSLKIIPAGQTCVTISVPIRNDNRPESSEYFYVHLALPINAVIADGKGVVTITDNDGNGLLTKSAASSPVMERMESKFNVSPNPFISSVRVNIESSVAEKATLMLVDAAGRELKQQSVQLMAGQNQLMLEGLEKLAAGTYFLRVISKTGGIRVQQLIKQAY
jgi:hypothetical protein